MTAFAVDTNKVAFELASLPIVARVGFYQPDPRTLFIGVIAQNLEPDTYAHVGSLVESFARNHAREVNVQFDMVDVEHSDELIYADKIVYA